MPPISLYSEIPYKEERLSKISLFSEERDTRPPPRNKSRPVVAS